MLNRITAQLPVEGLLFWKLSGREAMSESFALRLTVLGTDARLDRSTLLGQPVTITVPTQNPLSPRYINGKITKAGVSASELTGTRYAVYELTVEPDLWPMKRDRNLRIFQGQTVPQIVTTLLGEFQVSMENRLTGSYRVWDYCVQYQESSFDFISRLMELEGIAYHFRHEADRHTLVLTDAAMQHQPFSGYEVIPYHVTPSGGSTDEEGIGQWALEDSVTPGIYSLDDYDFRKPNAWLFQAQQNPASPQPGSIDVYDWPGRFVEHGHGEFYARIRQECWQVEHRQIHATATAMGIAPGYTFTLSNAPFFSDNGEYLTIAATYKFVENRYASGEDGNTIHRTEFTVIPSSVVYRPAQATPWPRTYGPQTAKVVGPEGQSIWTDRYGRVKVKFHWDRLAKGDDTSSCWVRVSSAWAGQGYGGVQIPRVGDEVVVDFINGDPDRPIITGRVYNEASMPPWALPAAATQMGFMSRTKDGSPDNANALRFEDKAGEEQVWIQAERNMDTHVKNDETHSVNGARSHYVRKNELHRVEANQTQAVKGGTEILTGKGKLDAAVEQYVIASGTKLRLVSGESAIELNANGKINLIGKEFNIFVEGEGYITTGGKLHLNTSGTQPGTTAPGAGHKGDIDAAVQAHFTAAKAKKASAPTSAAAATPTHTGTANASAHAEGKKTVIERDGTIETRSGGTLAWRNNNPGNIRSGNFADKNGAIGSGPGGFAVFPDGDTGNAAIKKLLNNGTYRNLSVKDAIKRYAPPVENDTSAYQAAIKYSTGLDIEKKLAIWTIVNSIRSYRQFGNMKDGRQAMLILKNKIKGMAGLLFLLFSASLYAETVYHYEPETVTIVGKVVEKQFAGPPGYGENASDKKVTVPVVILPGPVSVLPMAGTEDDDPDNQPEQEVRSMQVFSYQGPVTVRGCAKLEGNLMHQVSADHYTKVLLIVKNAQKIASCR